MTGINSILLTIVTSSSLEIHTYVFQSDSQTKKKKVGMVCIPTDSSYCNQDYDFILILSPCSILA